LALEGLWELWLIVKRSFQLCPQSTVGKVQVESLVADSPTTRWSSSLLTLLHPDSTTKKLKSRIRSCLGQATIQSIMRNWSYLSSRRSSGQVLSTRSMWRQLETRIDRDSHYLETL
jgi:hypothetical protein